MWWFIVFLLALPTIIVTIISIYFHKLQKRWGGPEEKNINLSFPEFVLKFYNLFPSRRYVGYHTFLNPNLLIRDLDLINQLLVNDLDYFTDHPHLIWEETDPLWSQNLFFLKGKKWKQKRTTLSLLYTEIQIKSLFYLVQKKGQHLINYLLDKNEDSTILEMKEVLTRFTCDVIASIAFGLELDSLKEPQNKFYLYSKSAIDFTGLRKILEGSVYFSSPKIAKLLNISLFPKKETKFFDNLVKNNIKKRLQHRIVRPDMIQILLEARKDGEIENLEITNSDITSQALSFIFAGYDTVSTLMSFMSYELALNPKIQKLLIQEIDSCDEITYESLTKMKYLDMVLSETLRKWPITAALDRTCTKEYTIEPKEPGECLFKVEKGTTVLVPIFGIHRDSRYYPDPERFDPERFSDENKSKIVPFSYLPFGIGPRNCIGIKFAIMQTKVLFCLLLRYFEIERVERTPVPVKFTPQQVIMTSADGFWLGVKRRVRI